MAAFVESSASSPYRALTSYWNIEQRKSLMHNYIYNEWLDSSNEWMHNYIYNEWNEEMKKWKLMAALDLLCRSSDKSMAAPLSNK